MKKTIFLLAIVALISALFRWLTSDKETKQKVEETETANNEKEENVKPGKTADEIAADMKCSRQTVYRKLGPKNPKT